MPQKLTCNNLTQETAATTLKEAGLSTYSTTIHLFQNIAKRLLTYLKSKKFFYTRYQPKVLATACNKGQLLLEMKSVLFNYWKAD